MPSRKLLCVLKYIVLAAVGGLLFSLCCGSGQALSADETARRSAFGGEWLLLGLPMWYATVAAVGRPIVADVKAMLRTAEGHIRASSDRSGAGGVGTEN